MTSLVSTSLALILPFLACAGLMLSAAPAHAADPTTTTSRFALVIGSNETQSKDQKPLRFADDDAARMAELWLELGAEAELLTVFDQSSQVRFRDLVKRADQPTE